MKSSQCLPSVIPLAEGIFITIKRRKGSSMKGKRKTREEMLRNYERQGWTWVTHYPHAGRTILFRDGKHITIIGKSVIDGRHELRG